MLLNQYQYYKYFSLTCKYMYLLLREDILHKIFLKCIGACHITFEMINTETLSFLRTESDQFDKYLFPPQNEFSLK